jgi:two-component system sensor histidine kinase YesM
VTGLVYIAVDTSIITDTLIGYETDMASELLVTAGNEVWTVDGPQLLAADASIEINNSVASEIRPGFFLTQVLGRNQNHIGLGNWAAMLAAICIVILFLSFFVIWMMNRTISRPVARIRKKAEAIAKGDFSQDESIESDNEIGEVGRSINQLSRNILELMETRVADEQSKRELEYRMLQGQINPHFLYNTLGAIKWMAALQKATGIEEMTTALSRMLRTAAKDQRKVVPLKDEIALLDDYYTILKYRYGNTVQYDKRIEDPALLDSEVPRFVLQPLMENAIFHGIEPKGSGCLELAVTREGPAVCVSLKDDGVGVPPDSLKKLNGFAHEARAQKCSGPDSASSIGLRNVHWRIQAVFGPGFGLTVESEENLYTKAIVRVPVAEGLRGTGDKVVEEARDV